MSINFSSSLYANAINKNYILIKDYNAEFNIAIDV